LFKAGLDWSDSCVSNDLNSYFKSYKNIY